MPPASETSDRSSPVLQAFAMHTARTGPGSPQRAATLRPYTALTSKGELVGYQTTNHAAYVDNPLTGGPAAPGAVPVVRPATVAGDVRYHVMPRAMAPGEGQL